MSTEPEPTITFDVTTECLEARIREHWKVTVPASLVPAEVAADDIDTWMDSTDGTAVIDFIFRTVDNEGDREVREFEVIEPTPAEQPFTPWSQLARAELETLKAIFDEDGPISGADLVDYLSLMFDRLGVTTAAHN